MTLVKEWKLVAKRAWSFRLMILAAILSGCEAALPIFNYKFPPGIFAIATVIVSGAACYARITAQPKMNRRRYRDND